MSSDTSAPQEGFVLPILPLRSAVVFPMSVVPINVGRPKSIMLVEDSSVMDQPVIGVIRQKQRDIDDPTFDDLHEVGTVVKVVHLSKVKPKVYVARLQGIGRFRVVSGVSLEPFVRARVTRIPDPVFPDDAGGVVAKIRNMAYQIAKSSLDSPEELLTVLRNVQDPVALCDAIAATMPLNIIGSDEKQEILGEDDPLKRYDIVEHALKRQLKMEKVRSEVSAMQRDVVRSEREALLRKQMKEIREKLGEATEDEETEELRERLAHAGLPEDARKAANKQIARMGIMHPQSGEWNNTRTYLEWLADLPWSKTTEDHVNVDDVRRVLDEDHYGLQKVKRRIIEYVAVRQLRKDKKGPILLFAGPPGVGKTSLGRSIARATGRRYGRIALGGVGDEAEIRGHRRTYTGALPGRILQAMKRVGVRNPVLVLDEVDKLTVDLHGDPAAALLEVLDPDQNHAFVDHYLDLPFDLSQVIFLATANNLETIPGPLMDRMELIEVPGYTRNEKLRIATDFLVPKQLSEHGLTIEKLEFPTDGLLSLIDEYTREAGVRNLEREIGAVCRAAAVRIAGDDKTYHLADKDHVVSVLGAPRFRPDKREKISRPGVVAGLAWTPTGGEILFIEATKMPGSGKTIITGNIRSVMEESAAAALSFVRANAKQLMLDPQWLKNIDIHIHLPKGAVSKDGPSAGIAMFVAVASLLLQAPVRRDVAITGEISLRGVVLPVGGIKEKLIAAHRANMTTVLIPKRNERDIEELPEEVRRELSIQLISHAKDVLPLVLEAPVASPEEALDAKDEPPQA